MTLFRSFSFLVLVLVSLSFTAGCQENVPADVSGGRKAPEISGTDVNGKVIALSQYQGKVVLLDFWATWCGYCVAELPQERTLQRDFDGGKFAILGISADRSREELASFLQREQLPWANIFDPTGTISKQWGVSGFPTFVLIGHDGSILKRWSGAGRMGEIRAEIEKALKEAK